MNKREISALEKAFAIPEPLHKKEFAAKFRELEKDQKKRSFISPSFFKLASTAVMCALVIGVWANMDDSGKIKMNREDLVSSITISEITEDNDISEESCAEPYEEEYPESTDDSEESKALTTTVSSKKTTVTKTIDKTTAKTTVSGTKTTSEKSEKTADETTVSAADNSVKDTTASSEKNNSENKTTAEPTNKTTEKTTAKQTTEKPSTTKATTARTETTKATTVKATTTKETTAKNITTKATTAAAAITTPYKAEQPANDPDDDKGGTGNSFAGGGEPITAVGKDMTIDTGIRIYPNGNYVSRDELTGNSSKSENTAGPSDNSEDDDKRKPYRYSNAVITGIVDEVIYTKVNDECYVQLNITVQDKIKGVLNEGDRISVFYDGGYMYASEYLSRVGIDKEVPDDLMVDLNYDSSYEPEAGKKYFFFLIYGYRYITDGAYMLSSTGEESIFRMDGIDCYDKYNSYAFNLNDF